MVEPKTDVGGMQHSSDSDGGFLSGITGEGRGSSG
jgi:hypothetical protein